MSEDFKKIEKKERIKNNEETLEDYAEDVIKLAEFLISENIFIKNEKKDIYSYDGKKYNLLKHEDLENIIFNFFVPYEKL